MNDTKHTPIICSGRTPQQAAIDHLGDLQLTARLSGLEREHVIDCREVLIKLTAERVALLADNERLREALRDVLGLIDSQWLVRNTDDDSKPDFALRQLEPTRKLAKAQAALSAVEGAK